MSAASVRDVVMSSPALHDRRIARLDVGQVHAMLDAGILRDGEAVELIDGVLVCKDRSALGEDVMTIGKRHNLVVKLLARLDPELAQRGRHMQTQGPLTLPPRDEPEPDGIILRGDPRSYADHLPEAADAESVIEVADASLAYDRTTKLALYARAGIRQYVIVNLQNSTVEIYEQPSPAEACYRATSFRHAGETVALRVADGEHLEVDAARLLP